MNNLNLTGLAKGLEEHGVYVPLPWPTSRHANPSTKWPPWHARPGRRSRLMSSLRSALRAETTTRVEKVSNHAK